MPEDDVPGPPFRQAFNALIQRGMTTEKPVVVSKPIQFKPR